LAVRAWQEVNVRDHVVYKTVATIVNFQPRILQGESEGMIPLHLQHISQI